MQIKCKVQNINSESFRSLQIKRMRQVLFFNDNRDKIQIYTALLVGSNGDAEKKQESIISEMSDQFKLDISFDIKDDKITCNRICAENHAAEFFSEVEKIAALWGRDTRRITKQKELISELRTIVETVDPQMTSIRTENYIVFANSGSDRNKSVACEGNVTVTDKGYSIMGRSSMHKGIDCVSWVCTTIELNRKCSIEENIEIELILPNDSGNVCSLGYVSMYFCPPEGYYIPEDTKASIWCGSQRINNDENNNLMPVVHNKDMYYNEWVNFHHIESRTVYRINREKLFGTECLYRECDRFTTEFQLKPSTEKGSIQFVLAAIVSAAVTFGVDSGRLGEIKSCFISVVPADIQWYVLCFFLAYALLKWCSKKENLEKNWKDRVAGILFFLGMFCTIAWFIYTYVFFRLDSVIVRELCNKIPPYCAPVFLMVAMVIWGAFIVWTSCVIKDHYSRRPLSKGLIL